MANPDPVFEELMRKVRSGDAAALDELSRIYEPDLRIAARVHLGPALRPYLDSIDLVQSVHRSLMIGLRNQKFDLHHPGALISLALTMVRRKVSRHWQKQRRQIRLDNNDSDSAIDILATMSSRANLPDKEAEIREDIAHLWDNLNEEDRIYLTHLLHGYTTVEAAELMGKSAEALRIRLFRIRKHLADKAIFLEVA